MLNVIGAGFGRTGTLSLKTALDQLGFGPCYHMVEVLENPDHIERWQAAHTSGTVDWEQSFAGYRATVDWPGVSFWRQLVTTHPEARVILTVRDPQRWYDSVRNSIYRVVELADEPEFQAMKAEQPHMARMQEMVGQLVWDGEFGGRFTDREHAINMFEEHNAAVHREVPADRLLVFEVSQGWEPLCDFLGVDVPDEPFPRVNDSQNFEQEFRDRMAEAGQ